MPGMLGLHPYFPQPAMALVQARARTVWLTDAQSLPVQEVLVPVDWSFDRARGAARIGLDHCLDHWDGVAGVRWPDRILTISAVGCRSLHVYTPLAADFFSVWSHRRRQYGALNRDASFIARLAPGERLEMKVRFSVGHS